MFSDNVLFGCPLGITRYDVLLGRFLSISCEHVLYHVSFEDVLFGMTFGDEFNGCPLSMSF